MSHADPVTYLCAASEEGHPRNTSRATGLTVQVFCNRSTAGTAAMWQPGGHKK